MKFSLHQHLNQLAMDRWARQGVRRLLRAMWLSGCVWCIGLGGHMLWDWPLRFDLMGLLALAIIGVAVVSLLKPRMSEVEVARRLDRRFRLNEQLSTAVEIARTRPPRDSLAARLLAESGRTSAILHQRIDRRQTLPWSEILLVLAMGFVLLGLYIISGIGRFDPNLIGQSTPPLSPLVQPAENPLEDEPFTPPQGQQPAGGQNVPDASRPQPAIDPQTLGALADALRDQGATRPAADALDRGDVPGAAQALRELADQAGQLSQDSRNDLSDRLREAANELQSRNPGLADQLRQSAQGLERGGQAASQALDDLARAIEELQTPQQIGGGEQGQANQPGEQDPLAQGGDQGQAGQPGGQQPGDGSDQGGAEQGGAEQGGAGAGAGGGAGNTSGEQRQAAQSPRLGVEGQPLELDAQGSGQASEGTDQPPTGTSAGTGFVQGGGNGQRVQTGADPLRVPVDERDVVQEYFNP